LRSWHGGSGATDSASLTERSSRQPRRRRSAQIVRRGGRLHWTTVSGMQRNL
jgi:hypothetical protein